MTHADITTGYIAAICIGLGVIILPPEARWWAFGAMITLDFGHTLSPMVAAWSHPRFRRVMRCAWGRYVAFPSAVLMVAVMVGWLTETRLTSFDLASPHQMFRLTDWHNPFPAMMWVYWVWNIWHFGMQNYGIACLCGLPRRRWAYVGATAAAMAGLPLLTNSFTVFLLITSAVSVNHWLVELGLTARISGRPGMFLLLMLAAGCAAFLWTVPTAHGTMVRMIPALLAARTGLGFVHFLYDRWIYRFSEPIVRATIGRAFRA